MFLKFELPTIEKLKHRNTVFPHIRSAGIIILHSLQMRVLLENTTFLLHKKVRIAGIIRGRALYEEIRYLLLNKARKTGRYMKK